MLKKVEYKKYKYEISIPYKQAVESFDRSLKEIRDDNRIMGGMVIFIAGDFRQSLLIIPKRIPAHQYKECIKPSHLWNEITVVHLTKNMRVHLHNDASAWTFCEILLQSGEDKIPKDEFGKIAHLEHLLVTVNLYGKLRNNNVWRTNK